MAQTPCLSLVSSAYRGLSVIFLKPDLKHRFLFTSTTRYLLRYFFIIQSVSKYPVWLQIFQHIFSLLLLHNSWKLPMLLFLKKSSSLIKHSQDISTNLAWSSARPTPPNNTAIVVDSKGSRMSRTFHLDGGRGLLSFPSIY